MGRFLDEPAKTYKGKFLDEETPRAEVKPSRFGMGPIGYGMESVEKGLNVRDIPHIASKAVSGAMYGMPERIAKNPVKFGLSGPVGVGLDPYSKDETDALFPKANSEGGKMIGSAAELAAGSAPTMKLLQGAKLPRFGKNATQRFGDLQKKFQGGKDLSQELLGMSDEARKTAGAMQGGYINANAEELVNMDALKNVLRNLPKPLVDEIMTHPEIIRNGEEIAPTLKNAETIRGIIKGRVPSSNWNIKAVDVPTANAATEGFNRIGSVMTEGRPELAEAMQAYAKTKNAQKQLAGRLVSSSGMTKTKPIVNMFGKNAEGADVEAIAQLAEQNPEILGTVDRVRRFGEGVNRARAIQRTAKKVGLWGGGVVGGTLLAKSIFGGQR